MTDDTSNSAKGRVPNYEVGYGKPPKDTRFKKGVSGNPRGRPRGSKNKRPGLHEERLKDIILDEAYRTISVRDGDKNVTIPMAQAVMRSMAVNAAKGQHRAQRLFAELLSSTEGSRRALHDEWFRTAIIYKREWEAELDRRVERGITHLPDPLPHPDQIKINVREGTAKLIGPVTRDDKLLIDEWTERKHLIAENVEGLKLDLIEEEDCDERADIQKHIDIGERLLKKIRRAIPD